MMSQEVHIASNSGAIQSLCEEYKKYNRITPELYHRFDVKRGLRNQDGTGVLAGLTQICNVHGYVLNEGEKAPIEGELFYRGYNIQDIIASCRQEGRFGFEEVTYLLLFGVLPTQEQLNTFSGVMEELRNLPPYFFDDMILKAPSSSVMNKLARSVLALYSFDDDAEDLSLESEMEKALKLIAQLPNIMVKAYQVKRSHYDGGSMILHPLIEGQSTAESILSQLRPDRSFTKEEALLLDLCLILHAEHGGGNNSTFVCRTLTSSGTDAYSAYAGAIGSLKGKRHGGANINVTRMLDFIKRDVPDYDNQGKLADYLRKIIAGEAADRTGLIYGMGHAIYTKSDPRAVVLKENAWKLAEGTKYEKEFRLLELIEALTPQIFTENKGEVKTICANVDLYSGLVYRMLKIPQDLYTPLFACSRMAGWSAHRMEEAYTNRRIIRPAYKSVVKERQYQKLSERE